MKATKKANPHVQDLLDSCFKFAYSKVQDLLKYSRE